MTRLFITSLWALVLSACSSLSLASDHPLQGQWMNDAGSQVEFNIAEDGSLSGFYRTELGRPDAESRFPLRGWVQGDVIAFSVNFEGFESITSWSGQLSEDERGPFIRTLWHYTKDIPDEEEADDLWRTINAGSAMFRRASVLEKSE